MTSTPSTSSPTGTAISAAFASGLQEHFPRQKVHGPGGSMASSQSAATVPPKPGFRDATALFFSACVELGEGQMVAVPDFTLMDSMAAIKIMDARMDSGMELPATELPESERLDVSLAAPGVDGFDAFKPLTTPDVLWIMDRLLACEAAWHQGSALSQTLYTCLYFHAIKSLSHKHLCFHPATTDSDHRALRTGPEAGVASAFPLAADPTPPQLIYKVLRAFILATVKTIDIAWSELTGKQHLQDGEDFSSDKNGLSLLETTDPGFAISELDGALEWVQSQQDVFPSDHVVSLKTRLTFRKQMLYAVKLLQSPAEASPLDVVMHAKFARRNWTLLNPSSGTQTNPPENSQAKKLSPDSVNYKALVARPLQPPNRNAAPSEAAIAAFDPAYNRRLAWCQALRPISLPSADETWKILDSLLRELQDVVLVLQHPGFLSWKTFFTYRAVNYQSSQPLSATPYVRSMMQTAVCDRNMIASRLPLEWIAESFFREVVLIDPLLLRRASRIGRNGVEGGSQTMWNAPSPLGQQIYYFQQRLAGHLVQYLTTLSQNRSRCKRTLASRLYREWVNISEEASIIGRRLEECLAPSERYIPDSLFAATQHVALEIMTQITLSGFELDLYSRGTDSESMWWLSSRISVEQKMVCTDIRDELSKWLEQAAPDKRPRNFSVTILYLSRQVLLAQALEQLAVGVIYVMHLSTRSRISRYSVRDSQLCPWPLTPEDDSNGLEIARSVFFRRIKWMRSKVPPLNDLDRTSSQGDPCESLWQDYVKFRSDMHVTDDKMLPQVANEKLELAIVHLQHLADTLHDDKPQEFGDQGFGDLVSSLLDTARHNREALIARSTATKSASSDKESQRGSRPKVPSEWIFEHPWFPKWFPSSAEATQA